MSKMNEFERAYLAALREAAKISRSVSGRRRTSSEREDIRAAAAYTAKRRLLTRYEPESIEGLDPDQPLHDLRVNLQRGKRR